MASPNTLARNQVIASLLATVKKITVADYPGNRALRRKQPQKLRSKMRWATYERVAIMKGRFRIPKAIREQMAKEMEKVQNSKEPS